MTDLRDFSYKYDADKNRCVILFRNITIQTIKNIDNKADAEKAFMAFIADKKEKEDE